MSGNDSVQVIIPEPLRECVGGRAMLSASPGTVADIIVQLSGEYPEIGPELVTEDGQVAEATVIAVDAEDIVTMDGLDTSVKAGQNVVIVTSLPV